MAKQQVETDQAPQSIGSGLHLRLRIVRLINRFGAKEEYFLILVSILIGAATGIFAHLFYNLIEYAKHLTYGPSGHGGLFGGRVWMLVLLPVLGSLAVGYLVHYFAREAKGHGVPEVLDAMLRRGGQIRPRVAGAKAVASALTIGSGGSAGTEGPIIQIGATIASTLGQYFRIQRRQMGIVVGCGASAGIAAIFNAPIAGVMFALEIFLKDFSFRTFSPVVFSSVISCSIMHALRAEDTAIFTVQALREVGYVFAVTELPLFIILGFLAAAAAVGFTRALYFTEDVAEAIKIPEPLKPALGALGLGLTGVVYVWASGALAAGGTPTMPPFFGNGYPVIQTAIGPGLLDWTITSVVLLFGLKFLATCLTLGSGGSGGVFAPSLFMGAMLGGAFGLTLRNMGLIGEASVSAYALVGMATMVAGTTHAPLTAIVILYEITREPKAILPVMFAAIVATFGAQWLFRDSIYTLRLRRRGIAVGSVTDLTILRRICVSDVERQPVPFVRPEDPLKNLIELVSETDATDFVVVDDQGVYRGMVTGREIRLALLQPEAVSLLLVGELIRTGVPTVTAQDTIDAVLAKFARSDVESLPIANPTDQTRIEGIITRQAVMRRYQEELDRHAN